MGFYRTAIISFAIQLFIILAIVAIFVANRNRSQEFPATVAECPDFYSMDSEGNCIMDASVYDSTVQSCNKLKSGTMTPKEKKKWAADCGVAWDGITNISSI